MVAVTFTWNATIDARSCNKCKVLHLYSWIFTDEIPNFLDHPQFGPVWDLLVDQSMAHGFHEFNCRCSLLIQIDDSDMGELFKGVIDEKHGLEDHIGELSRNLQIIRYLVA